MTNGWFAHRVVQTHRSFTSTQAAAKGKKLIANPNCTTAIGLMALFPLHVAFGARTCSIFISLTH